MLKQNRAYSEHRKAWLMLTVISPFVFTLSFIQLMVFIYYKELSLLKLRGRLYFLFATIILAIVAFYYINEIGLLFGATESVLVQGFRGLDYAGLLKPFYAIYQFIFGYDAVLLSDLISTVLFCTIYHVV